MEISCAFATGLDTPDHIAVAERLGYRRAWCYDSPVLYADVWMTLARAAERTHSIGLGPGVLIPSLRHVMTNAAAIGTLVALAPGRVVAGIGSGFSGQLALGQRPLPWREVADYIRALRALLRGDEVEWGDAIVRMGHPAGFAAHRPIEIPLLVAAAGPRGLAVAQELGDGIFTLTPQGGFPWVAQLLFGTVLDPGEDPGSERALAAAGHGAAVRYHALYDPRGVGDMTALPRGEEWRQRVEALPARTRHLAVHDRHLVGLNDLDRGIITGDILAAFGVAVEATAWRARLAESERSGVTEIVFQPAGPDIERELATFASMASDHLTPAAP